MIVAGVGRPQRRGGRGPPGPTGQERSQRRRKGTRARREASGAPQAEEHARDAAKGQSVWGERAAG